MASGITAGVRQGRLEAKGWPGNSRPCLHRPVEPTGNGWGGRDQLERRACVSDTSQNHWVLAEPPWVGWTSSGTTLNVEGCCSPVFLEGFFKGGKNCLKDGSFPELASQV